MKKIKLLTTLMVATTCVAPTVSILSSCSCTDVTMAALQIKDDAIQYFMSICKNTHRNVWDEEEGFEFVRLEMKNLGYKDFAGRDYWSYIPEVEAMITANTGWKRGDPGYPNYGNIWYDIPASSGMEDAPKVILQAHLDSQMTFANDDAKKNWEKNGIKVTFDRDNDILHTDESTSLGADGGMGMALLLAIAKHQDKFKHGGIRLLFTAGESEATEGEYKYTAGASFLFNDQLWGGKEKDEEGAQSYLQASSLPFGDMSKKEFTNIISISGLYKNTIYRSVGGINEVCYKDNTDLKLNQEANKIKSTMHAGNIDKQTHLYTMKIDNLHGGKSSKDINSGYANALQMLNETLKLTTDNAIQVVSMSSQPGAYNIAKTANCTFASTATLEELLANKNNVLTKFKQSCKAENWNVVTFDITEVQGAPGSGDYTYGMSTSQSQQFIELFNEFDWGATEWFDDAKSNVKTSYNHGKLDLTVDQTGTKASNLELYTICRSNVVTTVNGWHEVAGALLSSKLNGLYQDQSKVSSHMSHIINPCWEGIENNKLINTLQSGYKSINISPKITDNHGWVEVGCLSDAFIHEGVDLQMAVLGIEINNSQEVTESVYTDSLNTLNKALVYTLEHIRDVK